MSDLKLVKDQKPFNFTEEQIRIIKATVAKGATEEELGALLHLAREYQLDPLKKEIWFIKQVKKQKRRINSQDVWDYPRLPDGSIDYTNADLVIMTSRDGFLTIAKRDPCYNGLKGKVVYENDEFEMSETLESVEVKHRLNQKNRGPIKGAWAAAFHTERQPMVVFVPFDEYFNDNSPIWKKNTSSMILKVAETFVLKRQYGIVGIKAMEELEEVPASTEGTTPDVKDPLFNIGSTNQPPENPGPSDKKSPDTGKRPRNKNTGEANQGKTGAPESGEGNAKPGDLCIKGDTGEKLDTEPKPGDKGQENPVIGAASKPGEPEPGSNTTTGEPGKDGEKAKEISAAGDDPTKQTTQTPTTENTEKQEVQQTPGETGENATPPTTDPSSQTSNNFKVLCLVGKGATKKGTPWVKLSVQKGDSIQEVTVPNLEDGSVLVGKEITFDEVINGMVTIANNLKVVA